MRLLRPVLLIVIVSAFLLLSACQSSSGSPSSLPHTATPQIIISPAPQLNSPTAPLSPIPYSPVPHISNTPTPPASSPTPQPITTLLFTGIIVPARCVQAGIDASGNPDYPYEEVRDLISQADLAIGTLNASISDFPPHTGCTSTFVLVGGSSNADALKRAGFDAMSVATNHIKNCGLMTCGDRAFLDTLDNLRRVGVLPVGGGKNLEEALQPVVLTANGIRFGIVSLGQIEPLSFAGENTPGIAVLNESNLAAAIAAARQISDVVIAMPHWGPEYVSVPNWLQRNLAKQAVKAGADLVVGNHTHVVQAVQEIDGVQVFYGLGNFVFDQYWQADLRQSVILRVKFQGKKYLGYELIPTDTERDGRVHIAGPAEAAEVLQRITDASKDLR